MTTAAPELEAAWTAWHTAREEELRRPHGWLSLAGLYWLDGEARAYPDLPGTWRIDGETVAIAASAADDVAVDGAPVDGTAHVEPVDGLPGVLVAVGERRVEVIRREHHFALRVRDPQAATRLAFDGVPAFPVSPEWIVTGRFTPWETPQRLDVDTVVEGLGYHPTAVGTVAFTLAGVEQELIAGAGADGALKLHFRDATSGDTTYGGGRNVLTDPPDADGTVRIDLNRTTNLPCAFSAYATCPLPPAGNTVTVPVEAGEMAAPRH